MITSHWLLICHPMRSLLITEHYSNHIAISAIALFALELLRAVPRYRTKVQSALDLTSGSIRVLALASSAINWHCPRGETFSLPTRTLVLSNKLSQSVCQLPFSQYCSTMRKSGKTCCDSLCAGQLPSMANHGIFAAWKDRNRLQEMLLLRNGRKHIYLDFCNNRRTKQVVSDQIQVLLYHNSQLLQFAVSKTTRGKEHQLQF